MNLTKKKLLSWYISRLHCLHETDIASKEAKAIEDLISSYGDGGPKVTREWADGEFESIEDGQLTKQQFYDDLRKCGLIVEGE